MPWQDIKLGLSAVLLAHACLKSCWTLWMTRTVTTPTRWRLVAQLIWHKLIVSCTFRLSSSSRPVAAPSDSLLVADLSYHCKWRWVAGQTRLHVYAFLVFFLVLVLYVNLSAIPLKHIMTMAWKLTPVADANFHISIGGNKAVRVHHRQVCLLHSTPPCRHCSRPVSVTSHQQWPIPLREGEALLPHLNVTCVFPDLWEDLAHGEVWSIWQTLAGDWGSAKESSNSSERYKGKHQKVLKIAEMFALAGDRILVWNTFHSDFNKRGLLLCAVLDYPSLPELLILGDAESWSTTRNGSQVRTVWGGVCKAKDLWASL